VTHPLSKNGVLLYRTRSQIALFQRVESAICDRGYYIIKTMRRFLESTKSIPIVFAVITLLAYGLLLPFTGFYWDDWPFAWIAKFLGPTEFFPAFAQFRPFLAPIFFVTTSLVPINPLAWQVFALVIRFLISITAWWAFKQIWRDKPVTEITNYIDGDFSRQFAEVLSNLKGPTFYWKAQDKIVLSRWASVLLGEGKDSKTFSPAEEEQMRTFAYDIRMNYHGGYITPKDLRDLAHMGNTPSEKSLSSKLLSKWTSEGSVRKLGQGKFQFVKKVEFPLSDFSELLKLLEAKGKD